MIFSSSARLMKWRLYNRALSLAEYKAITSRPVSRRFSRAKSRETHDQPGATTTFTVTALALRR